MSFKETELDSLPEEWEIRELNTLLIEGSRNGIYKKKEFHGTGIKIVNMGELFAYDRISNQDMKRVELDESEKSRFLLEDGDLLFARRSLTAEGAGKSSIVEKLNEETTYESSIIRIRLDKSLVNPYFLYYYFRSRLGKYSIGSIMRQTAVAGITGSDLVKLYVPIPRIKEQNAIVEMLSTIDKKIEVNNQINKTLEEMAQAIFKQWFIDFEFPNVEGEPYKSSGGEMIESELGMIPKGWEVRQLGEVCEVKGGKRLPKGKSVQDEKTQYPYIRVTDVNDGNIDVKNIKYIDSDTRQAIERYIINYEDVFISIAGTIGLVGTIPKLLDKASLTENMARIVTNELNKYFIKLYLNSKEGQFYITSKQVGSTQPKLPLYAIRSIPVIVADEKINKKFSTIIDSIFKKVESNLEVSNSLSDIRDTLLPKLMSGELRVPLND